MTLSHSDIRSIYRVYRLLLEHTDVNTARFAVELLHRFNLKPLAD